MKWDRRKRMSRHGRGTAAHTSADVRTGFQSLAHTSWLLFAREKYTQMRASSSFPIQLWAKCLLFFLFSPFSLLFLQSNIKSMNIQLGKEKCHWLRTFFAFGKPETLLGVCLLNLLFAVQNLGGKLQNVAWLQMLLCFSFFFFFSF